MILVDWFIFQVLAEYEKSLTDDELLYMLESNDKAMIV
jgi:hypothetical protein